jgi:serine/threonine protein kinase/tetratricopeptide (TPR) repeat protein
MGVAYTADMSEPETGQPTGSGECSSYELLGLISSSEHSAMHRARAGSGDLEVVLRVFADEAAARSEYGSAWSETSRVFSRPADLEEAPSEVHCKDGRVAWRLAVGPGETLEQRLGRGPIPIGEALEIVVSLASALRALHDQGIAHGHLNPDCVWLESSGLVRLLGVGLRHLRRAVDPGDLQARTVAYLAPEILLGSQGDAAADLWALAVVFSEMVFGTRPFDGDDTDTLNRRILGTEPALAADARTGIDQELVQFFVRALDKDPGTRLSSAEEALAALSNMTNLLTPATEMVATGSDRGVRDASGTEIARPPSAIRPGMVVGHYDILQVIGRGGMGQVFRGRDQRLGRMAALKFLPMQIMDEPGRERFVLEAKTASALDHPNICTVYGIDETPGGETFIAMALGEGGSLADRIASGAMSVDEALGFAEQVASGLAAAHKRGIVHCDIKPANIVLTGGGLAKIVDFGVARFATQPSERGGSFAATAGYAAPEQLLGGRVDHRADIWAVGVLLYEMLSGQRAFRGTGVKALMESVERDPEPVESLVPDLPRGLGRIVRTAMAKDPEHRYPTMEALLGDLRQLSSNLNTGDGQSRRARVPHRWIAGAGMAVILALAGLVAVTSWRGSPENGATPVVVTGLRDLGPGDDTSWLAGALMELLRLELDQFEALELRSSTGIPADLSRVGSEEMASLLDEVGARAAVGGVYRVDDDAQVEIELELRRPGTAPVTVASTRPIGDILALVAGLAAEVGNALDLAPKPRPPESSAAWPPPSSDEMQGLQNEALALQRVYDSPSARAVLERAISLEPGNPLLHILLGDTLLDLGREDEARSEVEVASGGSAYLGGAARVFIAARLLEARRERGPAAALYRALWASDQGLALPGETTGDAAVRLATALVQAGHADEALAVFDSLDVTDGEPDPRIDLIRSEAFHWLGRYEPQFAAAQRAVELATRQKAPFVRARALRLLGAAYWRLGDLDQGLETLAEARDLYTGGGHLKGEADVERMIGILQFEQGRLWEAKANYDRAASLYATLGNRRSEARALTNKALVLELQGDLDATIEVTRRALELFRQSQDPVAELITLVNLGEPLMVQGRLDEAQAVFDAALERVAEVDRFEAWTLYRLSDLLVLRGDLSAATARLDQALQIQEDNQDQLGWAESTSRLAGIRRMQGQMNEAMRLIEEALPVLEQRGTPGSYSAALRRYGECLTSRGDLERARSVLEQALKVQLNQSAQAGRSYTEVSLAEVLISLGEVDEAEELVRRALTDFAVRQAPILQAGGHRLLAEIAIARGDGEVAGSEIDAAETLLSGHDGPLMKLRTGLTAERVRAMDSAGGRHEALQHLLAEATSRGFLEVELEIRMAIGAGFLAQGDQVGGSARLGGVIAEAALHGLGRIEAEARSVASQH